MHSSVMIYADNIKRRKIVFFDFTTFISREVDGNFECIEIYQSEIGPLTVWVNEKRDKLPLNKHASRLVDFNVHGNAIFLGEFNEDGKPVNLLESQVKHLLTF
jgi:hypothetical protein